VERLNSIIDIHTSGAEELSRGEKSKRVKGAREKKGGLLELRCGGEAA